MLYCEEAINCDSYGEAMTFDLDISGEKKEERDDSRKGKETKNLEFIMKSSVRVCVHRKSSEWKECSESRKPSIVVYNWWKLEFKVNQEQYLYGHEGQQACFTNCLT